MKDIIDGQEFVRVKHVKCMFCGSTTRPVVMDVAFGMKASVARCPQCNFEYQTPQPSVKATEAYMNWRWQSKDKYVASPWRQLKRASDQFELIKPYVSDGMKVLDLGAGSGAFVKVARQQGFDAVGYDRSEGARLAAKKLHDIELEATLPSGKFDIITLWDVVEHLKNPRERLGEFKAKAAEGGRFFFETGNLDHAQGPEWGMYLFDHQSYFSPYTLDCLLGECGFVGYEVLNENGVFTATCTT